MGEGSWFTRRVSGIHIPSDSFDALRHARQNKQGLPWGWKISKFLVFDKVREELGFERAHYLATAAAPMSIDTSEFFLSLNLPICDVYVIIFLCYTHSTKVRNERTCRAIVDHSSWSNARWQCRNSSSRHSSKNRKS